MATKIEGAAGSVTGGVLLITGCCVGAGMLGLPVLSALAGFKPSLLMFFISWLFMTCTGLLLLEVNLWFSEDVSIVTMADKTLGTVGKAVGWLGFLFLFYALMVAYISGSGALFSDFVKSMTSLELPHWVGSLAISALFGGFVYLGTQAVDHFNRILILGLAAAYVLMIAAGIPHIDIALLNHSDWKASPLVVPALIISFGFHNLVPSLKTYLKGDLRRLRKTIVIGSAIPLAIYLVWETLILGLIPLEGEGGFRQALDQGEMATQVLRNAAGMSWIVDIAQYFAFFAIVTSFLGVALSFVDFLADGLHVKKDHAGKFLLCLLVIAPPFVLGLFYPKVFLIALNYAGGFGAVSLFGLLPAAMVWAGRYRQGLGGSRVVPGGKLTLLLVFVFALFVIFLQFIDLIN